MKKYIQTKKIKKNINYKIGNFQVMVTNDIDSELLTTAIETASRNLPDFYSSLIDIIYIGQFKELQNRNLNALYASGAILATNEQENPADLIEDVVHEVSHAVEERYASIIYDDRAIEREFLQKRYKLEILLKDVGVDTSSHNWQETSYNAAFDSFLYQEVGYPLLSSLTVNLFFSPYGATSLREYWGNGFEAYYAHRDVVNLKRVSPVLYGKITQLQQLIEENE